jgi:Fic family protein
MSDRAGRYRRQPNGNRAFIPAPLPPEPPIRIEGELQALLAEADRALGRLDESVLTLPNPDLFVPMYVRKEAVFSCQIEGAQNSLQDLLAAEAELGAADFPRGVDEVINYVGAMKHGLKRLTERPVSVSLIKEVHEKLLPDMRGGRQLRLSQNWIGPKGAGLNEATFVPPPADVVAQALAEMEQFLHQEDQLPLLIKIGLVHVRFETIHPFLHANGRLGRLLITFLLAERGVLHQPVLYLSHYFKRHRQEYYEHLQAVRDRGDWEGWLSFFLRGIVSVSNEAAETARRILQLREKHRTAITAGVGRTAGKGHKVLESLFLRPIVSVHDVQRITQTSYAAANKLVGKLSQQGILIELTGNPRNRHFRYDSYVRLFTDEQAESAA